MKQTAVQWLFDQMFKQGYFDGNKPLSITNLDHLEHQAKEMEKQQIVDAYETGSDDYANYNYFAESGTDYYNKKHIKNEHN